eukprot:6698866-Pyramimonas_sp.AAC.1
MGQDGCCGRTDEQDLENRDVEDARAGNRDQGGKADHGRARHTWRRQPQLSNRSTNVSVTTTPRTS